MGHKSSVELGTVMNEIIDKSINTTISKKCKSFDATMMAAYVENNLSEKERRKYEKHLFNCQYCFNIYNNIQEEIEKVYKAKYFPVMDKLLDEALKNLDIIEKEDTEPGIIVRLINMGMEILNINEFDNLIVEPVPLLRGKNKKNLVKNFTVSKKLKDNSADVILKYFNDNEINLTIKFLKPVEKGILSINSNSGDKIKVSLKQVINIDDLTKGEYKLFINKKFFINLEIK